MGKLIENGKMSKKLWKYSGKVYYDPGIGTKGYYVIAESFEAVALAENLREAEEKIVKQFKEKSGIRSNADIAISRLDLNPVVTKPKKKPAKKKVKQESDGEQLKIEFD